nr:MAG: Putative binding domain, N-terminal [Bacteriophage sp.]
MNIYIPIADITLTDGQTYDGQLPVWATRPLMVKVTTGKNEPVNITVRNSGSPVKTVTLPYQQYGMDIDLSFAAPLLKRADRNESEGTPWFMQQELLFWVSDPTDHITIPVFHCDLTYWDTIGVDAALPQPAKPRIPGHTLDIFFPYVIHPSDALSVQVEPVTGAPSSAILPVTYVLGDTIDITYIKKLTIKNVWGNGLDQVINYEDRLMSDAVYDTGLQCALRARWNMRNGQWFWAAFKDYFWSNKFTPIRGRGGVTEQAEITINLEYGEEYYNVYQELLVSSNVVFELNLPGINQYQSKRFKAEVSGDTGARWSNSTKTYRQQVRFKTTELQDNYMFPLAPNQPSTPLIAFSAQKNPWTIGAAYAEGLVNSIYSNAAWEVQSEPSWLTVTNGTTLFNPDMFEQGGLDLWTNGSHYSTWKTPSSTQIRLKNPVYTLGEIYSIIGGASGYDFQVLFVDENGNATDNGGPPYTPIIGRHNFPAGKAGFMLRLVKSPVAPITPADVSGLYFRYGKRYHQFPAGTSNLTATVAASTGETRTGNIVLKSLAGSTTYIIPVTQQKASISLSPSDVRVGNAYQARYRITTVTANTDWYVDPDPQTWIDINPTQGVAGTRDIFVNIQANTGAQRTTYVTFRSRSNTSVYRTLTIMQASATGNISVDTPTFNVDYVTHPITVNVTSFGSWVVSQRDTWITPSVSRGSHGTTPVTLTIADNTGNAARTGTITFYNDLIEEIAVVTVNQTGKPASISITPSRVSGPKDGRNYLVPTVAVSENNWTMSSAPSWVSVTPTSGEAGQTAVGVKYDTANPGAARTGQLRIENTVTHEIAICLITQEG